MARRSYKSDKRRKEINRLKKQAEKREKRFSKKEQNVDADPESNEGAADTPEQETQPENESV